MDEANLRRLFKDHRIIFTDSELIAGAFNTSLDFPDWEQWFAQIKTRFNDADIHKLHTASVSKLKELSPDVDFFSLGYITPEQSAAETIEGGNWIPRKFLLFLQAKTKDDRL